MMGGNRAETVSEANAQSLTLPAFEDWRVFAGLLNGYPIAQELGLDFHSWGAEQEENWQKTGHWNLDALELRLMLFFAFRADYMTGYTYDEHDEMADSLLIALSDQLGLPYQVRKSHGKKQS